MGGFFKSPPGLPRYLQSETAVSPGKIPKNLEIFHSHPTEKGNLRSCFAMLICLFAQAYSLYHNKDSVAGRLDDAMTYMNEHFKEQIALPEIAAVAALSVSQFVRVFKQNFGTTPIDYIIELRFNESCRLLKYTELAVAEIAYLVGFNDSNYFTRLFQKRFGITPWQARTERDI